MKKIIFFLETYFDPRAGGVQQSTSKMALIFKEKMWDVLIVSVKPGFLEKSVWNNIPVIHIGSAHNLAEEIKSIISKFSPKIIINQSGFNLQLTKILCSLKTDKMTVINTLRFNPMGFIRNHKFLIDLFLENKKLSFLRGRFVYFFILRYHVIRQKLYYKELLKNVDYLVVLSDSYKNEILKLSPASRKHSNKIKTIPNMFTSLDYEIDFSAKNNLIIYVGRLNIMEKRVDLLMNIWKQLHDKLIDWDFAVLGEGPDEGYMRNFCQINQLNKIKFYGKVIPDDMYLRAKIFHFTSSSEGFPNVVIEAQKHGCIPVIFNSFSSASDIIEDGESGFLIHPFDSQSFISTTLNLVTNKEIDSISKKCIESAKRFSYENISAEWDKLVNQ